MAYTTVYEGIVFVEGDYPRASRGPEVDCTLLGGGQLTSLDDVKHNLAQQAKQRPYNAVLNFTYGQKTGFFLSIFAYDGVSYWGKGCLSNLPQSDYQQVVMQRNR
jgi:hypothetical protein